MTSKAPQAERAKTRLYLVTPPIAEAEAFADALVDLLAAADVAAVLLRLAPADERTLINRIKTIASVVQAGDTALLIDGHADLVARAGADGAHLRGLPAIEAGIETLKPARIIGAGELTSRHDAMTAAERGADYVMFGEPDARGARAAFDSILERVSWWAEVFQVPCVGFATSLDEAERLAAAGADFIALGELVFDDPREGSRILAEAAARLTADALP